MEIKKMKLKYEDEVMAKLLDMNNKQLAMLIFNYHAEMKNVKNRMKKALDLLDKVSENSYDSEEYKKEMRNEILNIYNDLPRKSLGFIDKLNEKI
jgi:hypothetical protein